MKIADFKKAFDLHQKNLLSEAITEYLSLIKLYPNNEELNFYIGTAYLQNKDYKEAERYLNNVIEINKNNFYAYNNLAILFSETGDLNKSIDLFNVSKKINPNFSHTHNNLGNVYKKFKLYKESIESYKKAISIDSLDIFFINICESFLLIGDGGSANFYLDKIKTISLLDQSLVLKKLNIMKSLSLFSEIFFEINEYEKKNNLSKELFIIKLESKLLNKIYLDKTEINFLIKNQSCKYFLALYFFNEHDFTKSIQILNTISSNDQNYLKSRYLYAIMYYYNQDFVNALKIINKHLDFTPLKQIKSLIFLQSKKFKKGWELFKYRTKPFLKGINISSIQELSIINNNKTIVFPEQGIGDQIFFLSIINNRLRNPNFTFLVADKIYDICNRSLNLSIKKDSSQVNFSDYSQYIYLGDLAALFVEDKFSLERHPPIFLAQKSYKITKVNNKSKLLGISWFSKNSSFKDNKSLSSETILNNLDHYKFEFCNLEYQSEDIDFNNLANFSSILHNSNYDRFNNIERLADEISCCDYVVTVSNSVAHLSASLGVKTFILVPESGGGRMWYWHNEKESFWYSSANIFFFNRSNINKIIGDIKNIILEQ